MGRESLISVHTRSTPLFDKSIISQDYDALGRVIRESNRIDKVTTGRDFIHSLAGQILVERIVPRDGPPTPYRDYVWSLAYVNALAMAETINNGTPSQRFRIYPLQDANWNVTALVTREQLAGQNAPRWQVTERFIYDPYGAVSFLGPNYQGYGKNDDKSGRHGWRFLFQGGRLNMADRMYHFGSPGRFVDPYLGKWSSPDPSLYADGMNLHEVEGSNPVKNIDPDGAAYGWALAAGGAAVGVGVYLIGAAITGNEVTRGGILGAAASGFVAGAVVGVLAGDVSALGAIGIGALAGGSGALVGSLVQQSVDKGVKNIDWKQVGANTAGGVVGGAVGGSLFGARLSPLVQYVGGGLISGTVGGSVEGGIYAAWTGQDPVQGALAGARQGSLYGGLGGLGAYRYLGALVPKGVAASRRANQAQAEGRTTGVAAELRLGATVYTDVSTGGIPRALNPQVNAALGRIPLGQRSPFHGECAEPGCLSQALNAGVNPAGGHSYAMKIRG